MMPWMVIVKAYAEDFCPTVGKDIAPTVTLPVSPSDDTE